MLEKNKYNVVCDVANCRNYAEFCIMVKGYGGEGKFNICRTCAEALYAELGALIVPKGRAGAFFKSSKKHSIREVKDEQKS